MSSDLNRLKIGKQGENVAADFLVTKGMKIVTRNYHSRFGEVDIIASDDKFIAFVEVKTRAAHAMVSGIEAVDSHKQRKLLLTAEFFLQQNTTELQPRFDVIEVTHSSDAYEVTNYIQNAF